MNYSMSVQRHIPLSFYGTGIDESFPLLCDIKKQPNAFNDQSSDVLKRNLHSLHTKEYENMRFNEKSLHGVNEINKEKNNYLNPIHNIITKQEVPKNINCLPFQLQKEKLYTKEFISNNIQKGHELSSQLFDEEKKIKKRSSSALNLYTSHKEQEKQYTHYKNLNSNCLYLNQNQPKDKEIKHMNTSHITRKFNETSKEAPKWMKIINDESRNVQHINNLLPINNNNDTISLFSKFHNWITVSAKNRSRNQAFEKYKNNPEKQIKVRPEWMHTTHWNNHPKQNDPFISLPYTSLKSKNNKSLKQTLLIDKANNTKSIFSYGDFRHNVHFNNNIKQYEQGINRSPKQFFR